MIEELTPQVLMISMFLIIITAPTVTLLISVFLLWTYRRAVAREMAVASGFRDPAVEQARPAGSSQSGTPTNGDHNIALRSSDLYRRAISAPWQHALQYAVSGVAFALVFAVAAHFVYPSGLELPGFLIAVWIYAWPVFLALPLIVPGPMRLLAMGVAAYLAVFVLLGLWGATIENIPGYRFGAVMLPARSSVTPWGLLRLWLTVSSISSAAGCAGILYTIVPRWSAAWPNVTAQRIQTVAIASIISSATRIPGNRCCHS